MARNTAIAKKQVDSGHVWRKKLEGREYEEDFFFAIDPFVMLHFVQCTIAYEKVNIRKQYSCEQQSKKRVRINKDNYFSEKVTADVTWEVAKLYL